MRVDHVISPNKVMSHKYGHGMLPPPMWNRTKNINKVHISNFEGVTGSEDFACATLHTTPLDFQAKV